MHNVQTGTLSSLLNLSDAMPKYDSNFTQTVSKLLDTIRGLVAEDKQKMQSYLTVSLTQCSVSTPLLT